MPDYRLTIPFRGLHVNGATQEFTFTAVGNLKLNKGFAVFIKLVFPVVD